MIDKKIERGMGGKEKDVNQKDKKRKDEREQKKMRATKKRN